jgi:hypothetical protein
VTPRRPPDLLAEALSYAAQGQRVIPVEPAGKRPLTRRGIKDAARDQRIIRSWWRRWPTANIGMRVGEGMLVVDVDPRHDGVRGLQRLQREHGPLPMTRTARTGGGGAHYWYRYDTARTIPSRCGLLSGLDLLADGGRYVIVPPSMHASGAQYRWVLDCEPRPAPEWLLDLLEREALRAVAAPGPRTGVTLASVAEALARCPRIRARFDRCGEGLRDASPSGVDLGLAAGLALVGLDSEAIQAAIVESRRRAGLPAKRESYLKATTAKALRLAAEPAR